MVDLVFTGHALDMLEERKIKSDWVNLTLEDPERKERKEDGTVDYLRPIEEFGGRYLRVVTDSKSRPLKIITVFFDRRFGRKNEVENRPTE
ncbi:MAG: DUF4258 domain-containing protein [Actinobacteria bacterium]|nr:DUF4258 domain-containing protein [Actinomycetota bacterium]